MGAHFLGVFKLSMMHKETRIEIAKPPGLWSAYLMGLAFAFGWTPCIGPILAAILAVAGAQETVGHGALLLAAYAFGLGVPFVLAAIAMETFLGFARGFRGQFARLEKAVGALSGAHRRDLPDWRLSERLRRGLSRRFRRSADWG